MITKIEPVPPPRFTTRISGSATNVALKPLRLVEKVFQTVVNILAFLRIIRSSIEGEELLTKDSMNRVLQPRLTKGSRNETILMSRQYGSKSFVTICVKPKPHEKLFGRVTPRSFTVRYGYPECLKLPSLSKASSNIIRALAMNVPGAHRRDLTSTEVRHDQRLPRFPRASEPTSIDTEQEAPPRRLTREEFRKTKPWAHFVAGGYVASSSHIPCCLRADLLLVASVA